MILVILKFLEYFGIPFALGWIACTVYNNRKQKLEEKIESKVKYRVVNDILDEASTEELLEELSTRNVNDINNKG